MANADSRSGMDKLEEALLREMWSSNNNINSKSSAIAVAKSQGMMKQKGSNLALTKKGRRAAKKAKRD